MSKKEFSYEKLNEILYDNNNMISYIKFKSYSIWDDEELSSYFLPNLMEATDSNKIYQDIFKVLSHMDKENDLKDISNLSLNSSLDKIMNYLVENELIENTLEDIDINEKVSSLKSSQLKKLLKKHGIKGKGKRDVLLKLVIENIPESEFGSVDYKITSKGKNFLIENQWIKLYDDALSIFDFNDFYKYVNENQGDMYKLGLDFIDLHIKNAKRAYDFVYLDKCLISKSFVCFFNSDYENALIWELKRFILRVNPMYYSYINEYCEQIIFNPDNIINIKFLIKELAITDYNEIFNNVWDSLDLKNPYLSKNDTFMYLKKSLSEDIYDLSEEFSNKYFETAEEYFNLSIFHYKHHDLLLAHNFLEIAIENDPTLDNSLFYESLSACHIKNFDMALSIIDEALNINSNNGKYWCVKAIINFETNNFEKAIEYFKKALNLNPKDSFILNSIGVCYSHNNKTDDAIKYFEKAILYSDYIYPKLNLAKTYIQLGDFDKSEKYFNEISDQSMDYLLEKGCYYLIRKDYNKALDCFNDCIENHYVFTPILVLKYLALYELGHVDLYNNFKSKLRKLDLMFVQKLESFLRN